MTVHVLPGDSVALEFAKCGIPGDVIVCRECLVVGDADAETLPELWDQRARFILSEYGEDEIEYHDRVADELGRLGDIEAGTEVYLWFEYELFCSVNMWFCLWLLSSSGADIYRVEPIGLDEEDRWAGFGQFGATELKACFELRTAFGKDEVSLGAALWEAYRRRDYAALHDLAESESQCFPYLKEVVAAAATQDIRPIATLRAIREGGETDFARTFAEFKKRDGVYGYGDLQVQSLYDKYIDPDRLIEAD